MTLLALTRRERRTVLLGGCAIVALAVLTRGIPAWRETERDARASALELREELRRARESVQQMAATRDSLRARRDRLGRAQAGVLSGDAPGTAAAVLASVISEAASGSRVRLGAVQIRPDTSGGRHYARVAVRADATGDVRGITSFLSTLEWGPALVAIRELSISQPEPGADADRPETLRVELLVEGLALRHAPGAGT
ncbi:MAG: type II secretion system protein GspM [Gemmatimonadaceae bacterium]